MIAIFAEGIVISRAALKSLMEKPSEETTFCPKSVSSFAWPILDFVTVDRWLIVALPLPPPHTRRPKHTLVHNCNMREIPTSCNVREIFCPALAGPS